jgi:hypothetical protein
MRASAERIAENCEPSVCSVLFMGGAGGSLRAGVTTNPVRLTQSVKAALTRLSCGGASVYVWPGGGITVRADVMAMPANPFGYVPTSALVAPFEFTLRQSDYAALGGHLDHVQPVEAVMGSAVRRCGGSSRGKGVIRRMRVTSLGGGSGGGCAAVARWAAAAFAAWAD